MANVSSSNGLEKRPKLRFPGFDEPWVKSKFHEFAKVNPKCQPIPNRFYYVDLGSVEDGKLGNIRVENAESAPSRAQRLLSKDDILFQTVRPYQQNNFLFCNENELPTVASTGYAVFRTRYNAQYLYALIHTKHFLSSVLSLCTGTSFPAVSASDIEDIIVWTAGIEEQKKIGELFRLLNIKIAKQKALVEALKKYKRGLLMHYFSVDNTRQWTHYSISQIGKVITGSTPPTNDRSNYDGDLLFCSPGDIGEKKYISSTEKRVSPKGFALGRPLPPKSVIVTCIGLIGKLGITTTDMITNQQINALVVSDRFDHEFIYYAFENFFPEYRSKVSMQALPILSKSEFEKLMIKIPKMDEQLKTSNHLSAMDRRIEHSQKGLSILRDQRRGMMQQLFI